MSKTKLAYDITEREALALCKKMLNAMGFELVELPLYSLSKLWLAKAGKLGISAPCSATSGKELLSILVTMPVLHISYTKNIKLFNVFYGCKSIDEINVKLDLHGEAYGR